MPLAGVIFFTLVDVFAGLPVTAVALFTDAVESSLRVFALRVGVAVVSLRFAFINVEAFKSVAAESRITRANVRAVRVATRSVAVAGIFRTFIHIGTGLTGVTSEAGTLVASGSILALGIRDARVDSESALVNVNA